MPAKSKKVQPMLPFPKKEKHTIALIGCSKTKTTATDPTGYIAARDLYVSDLFTKRVSYVESRQLPFFILSAKCGILQPTTPVRPYDTTIDELSEIEVAEWNLSVANMLMTYLTYDFERPKLSNVTIEIHAGAKYAEPLGTILGLFGMQIVKPVESLGIGEQLAYYKESLARGT